ncbi:hypothetical protein AMATHDRAFT_142586 [Amanita thiersii Skay4041]|uniref:C2H2-type domain-containing protein n=1 Tax=Amanita thiersii Skay4041 TaxID=703135 RepID=A0A2A9NPZ8_9AGAR|nr:hypothetical protein AMATHDRAFT_142586 [Amanita thiersii Skay4041]
MDSIIEVQRQTHEELDRFHSALYTLLSRPQPTHERTIQAEHKAADILDRISARVTALNNLYDDHVSRKVELDALSFNSQQNDLSEFYSRLVKIQEHYSKYPDSVPGGFGLELAAFLDDPEQELGDEDYEEDDPISLLFSGEEVYGKYLDLYASHRVYCNLKNIGKRPGYLQYLDILMTANKAPLHADLSREVRTTKEFEAYLKGLYEYLLSFVKRTQPLVDVDAQERVAAEEFEKKWETKEIAGWEEISTSKHQTNGAEAGIWCSACQKHYSKQTVYDAHLTSKKHVKAATRQTSSDTSPNQNGVTPPPVPAQTSGPSAHKARIHSCARYTHLATNLLTSLIPTLNETKSNVERRFSLTAREREQELLEQSKPPPLPTNVTNGAEEEEEEERIYNPLKLPLGWDGKPIPYWLYKLHGLGVEYKCEICSDHVYMGRKNFDRHFQESRHAFGMRALGLPNTKHFHEITRIEDALALAEKLKQEGRHEIFEQETMEELEDDEGNVYNRKTYEDLKKQGLI